MGFDFKVEYKSGRENVATDILSKKYEEDPKELYAISQVVQNWLDIVKEEIQSNTDLRALVQHAQTGEAIEPWRFEDDILFFKDKIYLAGDSPLIPILLDQFHGSTHEGFVKTLQRVCLNFYWVRMRQGI